jgi:hypothetical protein
MEGIINLHQSINKDANGNLEDLRGAEPAKVLRGQLGIVREQIRELRRIELSLRDQKKYRG